ncbi:hypothetical protein SHIRM173S_02807 [Streptomyces hirsutus]
MDDGGLGILLAAGQIFRMAASYVGENGGAGIPAFFPRWAVPVAQRPTRHVDVHRIAGGVEHRGEERS